MAVVRWMSALFSMVVLSGCVSTTEQAEPARAAEETIAEILSEPLDAAEAQGERESQESPERQSELS